MPYPILITTATHPPAGMSNLGMTDPVRRTVAARAAILFWAAQGARQLVIADATGAKVLSDEDSAQLAAMGCTVEQISFHQDEALARERGKGFAEGRLVGFALDNSRLLADAPAFFKCTGKVFCRNFPQIAATTEKQGHTRLFWFGGFNGIDLRIVDVRFWLSDPAFCRDAVLPAYEGADDKGRPVEAVVTVPLSAALEARRMLRPRLSGFSGGFDQQYPEHGMGDLDYSFPCLTGRAA